MRGTDGDPHVHATHLGEPAFLGLAFQAASRADLERLAAAAQSPIENLDEPGGGEAVRLRDPDGRMVDVVFGARQTAPITGAKLLEADTCKTARVSRRSIASYLQQGLHMAQILVLYYSAYGHVEKMAQAVAEGVRSVAG